MEMEQVATSKGDERWADEVIAILKRGNSAEVKREKGNIVVVEIKRKVKIKTVING